MAYKVSLIGAGRIAGIKDLPEGSGEIVYSHSKAIHLHKGFCFSGVYDVNRAKAEELARIWSIPKVSSSIGDLLASSVPDVVIVCSNSDLHYTHVLEVLNSQYRPKLVLVEKPVCSNSSELKKLECLSKETEVAVVVNHTRRFDPGIRECSSRSRAGEFGEFVGGYAAYYGGWFNNGTHIVDTICMFLDSDLSATRVSCGAPGRSGDPCLDVDLLVKKERFSLHSFDENYYQMFEVDFRFSKGRVLLRDFGSELHVEKMVRNSLNERVLQAVEGYPRVALERPLYHAYEYIHRYFQGQLDLLETGAEFSQTKKLMNVMWACSSKVEN